MPLTKDQQFVTTGPSVSELNRRSEWTSHSVCTAILGQETQL